MSNVKNYSKQGGEKWFIEGPLKPLRMWLMKPGPLKAKWTQL